MISIRRLQTGGLQAKPQFDLLAQKLSQYEKHQAVSHKEPDCWPLSVRLFVSEI